MITSKYQVHYIQTVPELVASADHLTDQYKQEAAKQNNNFTEKPFD